LDVLAIYSGFRSNPPALPAVPFGRAIDYGFYRPDSQHGKGQYIKNCNLAQVEYAVKMDIKIEWNSDDDD
jgi:hypothetical protein